MKKYVCKALALILTLIMIAGLLPAGVIAGDYMPVEFEHVTIRNYLSNDKLDVIATDLDGVEYADFPEVPLGSWVKLHYSVKGQYQQNYCLNGGRMDFEFAFVADGNIDVENSFPNFIPKVFRFNEIWAETYSVNSNFEETLHYGDVIFTPLEGATLENGLWNGSVELSLVSDNYILQIDACITSDENVGEFVDFVLDEDFGYYRRYNKPVKKVTLTTSGAIDYLSSLGLIIGYDDDDERRIIASSGIGGSIEVQSSACPTDTIEFSTAPSDGYYLKTLKMYKSGDPTHVVHFFDEALLVMPSFDVVIEAEFAPIAEPEDATGIFNAAMTNEITNLAKFFNASPKALEEFFADFIESGPDYLCQLETNDSDTAKYNIALTMLAYENAIKNADINDTIQLLSYFATTLYVTFSNYAFNADGCMTIWLSNDTVRRYDRILASVTGEKFGLHTFDWLFGNEEAPYSLAGLKKELNAALADPDVKDELPSYSDRYKEMVYRIFCKLAEENDYFSCTYEKVSDLVDSLFVGNLSDMLLGWVFPYFQAEVEDADLFDLEFSREQFLEKPLYFFRGLNPLFLFNADNVAAVIEESGLDCSVSELQRATMAFYIWGWAFEALLELDEAGLSEAIDEWRMNCQYIADASGVDNIEYDVIKPAEKRLFTAYIEDITPEDADGYIVVSSSATVGSIVEVEIHPGVGYAFDNITVVKSNDDSVTVPVSGNRFRMPGFDVKICAQFKELAQPGSKLVIRYADPAAETVTFFEYDDEDRLVCESVYSQDGETGFWDVMVRQYRYQYDSLGRLSKIIERQGTADGWESYAEEKINYYAYSIIHVYEEMDTAGFSVQTVEDYYNGIKYGERVTVDGKETFSKYYFNGIGEVILIIEKENVSGGISYISNTKLKYDRFGNVTEKITSIKEENGHSWYPNTRETFEYNADGQLSKSVTSLWNLAQSRWDDLAETVYSYTEDGFPLKETVNNSSDATVEQTAQYFYPHAIEDTTDEEYGWIAVMEYACFGETVRVIVMPEEGYRLDTLIYTANGVEHEINRVDGYYQFVMEDYDTAVRATFTETEEKLFEDYKDDICEALEEYLEEEFGEVIENTIEKIQALEYDEDLTLDENKDRVTEILYQMLDDIEQWKFDQMDFFERHGVYVRRAWEQFLEQPAVKADAERLSAWAEDFAEMLGEEAVKTVSDAEKLEEKIDEVIIDTTEKINQTVEDVKEHVEEKTEELTEKINETVEDLKEKTEDTIEKAEEILGDTAEQIKDKYEEIKEQVEEKAGEIKDKLEDAGEEIAEAAGKIIGAEGNVAGVAEKAVEIGENVARTVGAAADNVDSTLGSLKEKADAAAEAGNEIVAPIAASIAAFSEEAQNNIATARESVGIISSKVNEASNQVQSAIDEVKKKVGDIKGKTAAAAETARQISEAVGKIRYYALDLDW